MENFNRIKRKTFSFHLEIPQIPPSSLTLIFLPLSIFPVLPPSDLPLLPKHLEALLLPLNIPPPPNLLHPWRNYNLLPTARFYPCFAPSPSLSHSFFLSFSLLFRLASVILFLLLQKTDRSKAHPLSSSKFCPRLSVICLCGPLSGFMLCSNSPFVVYSQNTSTHKYTRSHTTGTNHLRSERDFLTLWTLRKICSLLLLFRL